MDNKEERKKIREALLKGDKEVKITKEDNMEPTSNDKISDIRTIAEERRKIRTGEMPYDHQVNVTQSSDAKPASEVKSGDGNTLTMEDFRNAILQEDIVNSSLIRLKGENRKSFFTVNLDCNYSDTLTRESIINEIKNLYNEYNYLYHSICTIVIPNPKREYSPWYIDSKLLEQEIRAMSNIYPNFKLKRMIDGRLCWVGSVAPVIVREEAEYELKIIYDHTFKRQPFIIEIMSTDIDCNNKRDYCYAFDRLGKIFWLYSNSVVDCITMVTKWLNAYELLLADYITYEEFEYIAL